MVEKVVAVALLMAGCAGQLQPEPARELPAQCRPPSELACVAETLNDGTGPDDHRQVCDGGAWIFYPSGDTWHLDGHTVLCHVTADGTVQWVTD